MMGEEVAAAEELAGMSESFEEDKKNLLNALNREESRQKNKLKDRLRRRKNRKKKKKKDMS